ncbi:uncharacterized protein LOC131586348 [Poecile atricapillus]|uniref:uncharacterized protein LOC131586348 n=1 Tax=Poecile atricapillus TaxID=48891 RepID=UPI002738DF30|nr:uncharacterized protein LOC131586348 [Poecile atricapillus]
MPGRATGALSSEASPGLPTTTTAAARTFVPVLEDVGVAAAPLPLLALPLPPAPPPARHFKSARPDVPQSVPRNCLMEEPRAEQRPEEGTEGTRERRRGRATGGDEGTEGRRRERRRGGANGGEEELKPRKCSGTGHGRTATWRRPRGLRMSMVHGLTVGWLVDHLSFINQCGYEICDSFAHPGGVTHSTSVTSTEDCYSISTFAATPSSSDGPPFDPGDAVEAEER